MDELLKHATHLANQTSHALSMPIKGRVAYVVSHGQSYASNGYAIRTQGVAKALNQHGFETLCFVRPGRPWELKDNSQPTPPEVTLQGVRYIHSRWPNDVAPSNEREHLEACVRQFMTLFNVYRPEVVLAASNWIVGLPAWVAAKRLGLPFYNEVRGFWELSRAAQDPAFEGSKTCLIEAERDTFVAKQGLTTFTLNAPMQEELVKRGVKRESIQLVPNGVSELPSIAAADPALKTQLGIQEGDKVVGYIGSHSVYEGLDTLIAACEALVQQGQNIKLLLVGDHQPITQAHKTNEANVKQPWLIQTGRVLHKYVADYFALVDIIVIPRKPLPVCELVPPMKAAEALVYGKRLVVSNVAPLAEYAQKYDSVLSFDSGSIVSLVHALQSSWKLPEPKQNSELLFFKYTETMVKTFKGRSNNLLQLPFSDNINVDFCLLSKGVKKKRTEWTHVNVIGVNKISIRAESDSKIAEKKIILRLRCFNGDGQEVDPLKGSAYFSETYKWFRYVRVFEKGEVNSKFSVDLTISESIASIAFCFVCLEDIKINEFSASLTKELRLTSLEVEPGNLHEEIFDYLHGAVGKKALQAKAIIYGDVSPNVLDGSSIWLTSVTNIVSSTRPTLLLLKDNVKNSKVVSNIERHDALTVVEPKDIGFNAPLDQQAAAEAISLIYSHCPQVTALITRGVDLGYEIQKRKEFTGVFYPYVTDFYEISEQGFSLIDAKVEKLKEIVLNAKSIFYQTDDIHEKIEDIVGYKVDGAKLPPSIPDNLAQFAEVNKENRDGIINIGYAGKVQPRWGVEELIEEVERHISRGRKIKLHIATGKIHGRGKDGAAFVKRIRNLLQKDFVQLYDSLSREAAISLMKKMDLVWCYRDPHLENSTLELSTKLVETAALGKPCVVYGSKINKRFMGEDYPFFVSSPSEISHMIENFESLLAENGDILRKLANKVNQEFTFSSLQDSVDAKLDEDNCSSFLGKKVVVSGHDLKFIYSYITHLRRHGAEVVIDPWQWGEHVSLRLSAHYSDWGDYIFCEWGLANAVWHSKNKKEGKKLFIRVHAQEVRKKAAKFGRAIDTAEVDKFIFVSSLIRQQALNMFGWNDYKAETIPNAVKENRFYDPGSEVKPVLGMVGIVPTTKRLDRALDLLAALNERGWKAKLYCKGHRPEELPFMRAPGRMQELAYYEKLYKRIENDPNLNNYVFFDGWGNDVEQWYKKVSFILSPSDNESFHYALADGVMAGCLPLVWPWQGALETYCPDWIVEDTNAATSYIENHLKSSAEKLKRYKTQNNSLISYRYSDSLVFSKLNECMGFE